ncbi:DUF1003 domain-containing protein [Chitinophaga caseinilytica]|uniref:DUF1003 domain-containing protein n=1 Tax=Chitinophaga caseinilytica TaxID=2267521 RepID=A0ABZ2Z326_9BACT
MEQVEKEITGMIGQSNEQVKKLHDIVQKTMEEEELIVNNLLHPPKEILSRGQRISDKVARFGGSWAFICSFAVILVLWVLFNVLSPLSDRFDPYPFILMNLVLSCIAALQAPIIMMSQNRQEEKDRMRNENDYLVNLKAELEIRSLHQKIDILLEEQVQELYKSQEAQLALLKELMTKIEKMEAKSR